MAFEKIIGNKKVKETLKSAIKTENILHSYMFYGQEGIGKFLIAKEFAKAILGEENENNPDYLEIEPDGNAIKIEQIRYMNSKIIEKPVKSKKKVYIINDSDTMTREAQNSLLKTLEEPPEYTVIILICKQPSNLLPTIQSRCTKIAFQELTKEELKQYFKETGKDITEEVLELAQGSISKALQRIPKQETYKKLEILLKQIEEIEKLQMLKQEWIYQEKEGIEDLLEAMNDILFKIAKEEQGKSRYLNCINIVEHTKEKLKANSNFDMCIDNLLLDIWEEINETNSRS